MSVEYKHIAIVGIGVIGGSLGLSIKRRHPTSRVIGISRPQTLEEALEMGAIDEGYPRDRIETALTQADLVFLCTPIQTILELLPIVGKVVKPGTLVTDVGSTKRIIVETAEKCFQGDRFFVGGHPMAGNEGKGISWADPLLFENAVYVLTPPSRVPKAVLEPLGLLLESIGAKVLFLDPTLHDRVAAAVSHLPQVLAVTLMSLVGSLQGESEAYLKLAAGGFRDMTRIASSPFEMWRDIFTTNAPAIREMIDRFIEILTEIRGALESETMATRFEESARTRLSIPRDTKGFLRPHFDMTIQVEDKPGVIAHIASLLAAEGINIKDIEVLKVREGDSGVLRLAFESEDARRRAKEILGQAGLQGHIKR